METFEEKKESLNIEQDNKKYILTMELRGEELTLVLSNPEDILEDILSYTKKMTLNEIKKIHNYFNGLESCELFCKYLKGFNEKKQLSIIKIEEN